MAEVALSPPRFLMRGVRKAFGSTRALDGVNLEVRAGEVCALVGQNGAGKSTLMSILAGAIRPDAGVMTLDGRPFAPTTPFEGRRAGVAMIYQGLSLAPHLSVADNIALGVEPTRWGLVQRHHTRSTAIDALTRLGHSDISPDDLVSSLSPAGQQLVEIARAIASGCRVLVLDEPTSSLAHDDVRRLFLLVARLKAQGHAVVYISHFIEEVKAVSDRVVVLRDGRNAGEGATTAMQSDDIVRLMVGRELSELYPPRGRSRGAPALQVTGLQPGEATFTLHHGEILGIAGLIGAGRTRLLRTLFGLRPIQKGHVRVGAYEGPATPYSRWRQGMGIVSEDRVSEGLALGLTVADNLTMSRLHGLGRRFLVSPRQQEAATARWIDRLDIKTTGPRQAVASLSGGNQQKIALARLLHHDIDILVLDEPTRGVDVASKAEIYRLIDQLVRGTEGAAGFSPPMHGGLKPAAPNAPAAPSEPKAVLLVSSYLPELLGMCDRIAVMSRGRMSEPRPTEEWTEHDLLMAATGGGAPS